MKRSYLVKASQSLSSVHKALMKIFENREKELNSKDLFKDAITYKERTTDGVKEILYEFKHTAKKVRLLHKLETDLFEVKYYQYTRLPILSIDDLYVLEHAETTKVRDALDEKVLANTIYMFANTPLTYKCEKPNWSFYRSQIDLSLKSIYIGVIFSTERLETLFDKQGVFWRADVYIKGSPDPLRVKVRRPNILVAGNVLLFNALTDEEDVFLHVQAVSIEKLSTIINIGESDLSRLKTLREDVLTSS